jgi:hypothetical protein
VKITHAKTSAEIAVTLAGRIIAAESRAANMRRARENKSAGGTIRRIARVGKDSRRQRGARIARHAFQIRISLRNSGFSPVYRGLSHLLHVRKGDAHAVQRARHPAESARGFTKAGAGPSCKGRLRLL